MNERYVILKDFNTKDWCVWDDKIHMNICRCKTEQQAIEFVKKRERIDIYIEEKMKGE